MKLSPSEPSHCGELRPRRRKRASSSGVCESSESDGNVRENENSENRSRSIDSPVQVQRFASNSKWRAAAVTHRCRGAPPPSRWRHRIGWLSAHDDPGHTYRGFAQIVRGRLDLAWTPQELVAPSRENSSHSTAVTQGSTARGRSQGCGEIPGAARYPSASEPDPARSPCPPCARRGWRARM